MMGSWTKDGSDWLESWEATEADNGSVLDWTSSKFSITKPVRGPALYLTIIGSPLTSGMV